MNRILVAAIAMTVAYAPAFAADKTPTHHRHHSADASTAPATFEALDANKDGAISKVEAERNTGLKDAFATLDADKNGKLNKEEFTKFGAAPAAVAGAPEAPVKAAAAATPAAAVAPVKAANAAVVVPAKHEAVKAVGAVAPMKHDAAKAVVKPAAHS